MKLAQFAILFLLCLPCLATTRNYFIAAEDVAWDYAPSGQDLLHGNGLELPWRSHTHWQKTRFIEYADASFTERKPQPPWLGIMGPVIRAEVGDDIFVTFLNRSRGTHNIHPHGVRYDKASEGGYYLPLGAGSQVPPGGRFTYHWFADAGSGPGPGELTSVVWWYHPHIDEGSETNAGLMGPIIITAKGKARADGSPKDVDREFVASFMMFDEAGGKMEGMFYAINGYVFGNLPGLTMRQGDKVRWYLMGMGNEKDIHTPHWHGKTVTDGRRNTDVIELLPASMVAVDMVADNPGTWLFHCQVADHLENGMTAAYTIYPPQARACPVKFTAGTFWDASGKLSVTLSNATHKEISRVVVRHELLMTPQYLRRPFDSDWPSSQAMPPGGEQTIVKPGFGAAAAQSIMGWVLFPQSIKFADGTNWTPGEEGECFKVFWRDQDHPEMPALPPRQVELKED